MAVDGRRARAVEAARRTGTVAAEDHGTPLMVDAGTRGAPAGGFPCSAGVRVRRARAGRVSGADRLVRRPVDRSRIYADRRLGDERPARALPGRSCTGLRRDGQQWLSVVAPGVIVAGAGPDPGHRGRHVSVLVPEWRLRGVLRAPGVA